MRLKLRDRFIIWGSDKPWINKFFVKRAIRNDQKLAAEEFDKVDGNGLGTIRRKDGSIVAKPLRAPRSMDEIRAMGVIEG